MPVHATKTPGSSRCAQRYSKLLLPSHPSDKQTVSTVLCSKQANASREPTSHPTPPPSPSFSSHSAPPPPPTSEPRIQPPRVLYPADACPFLRGLSVTQKRPNWHRRQYFVKQCCVTKALPLLLLALLVLLLPATAGAACPDCFATALRYPLLLWYPASPVILLTLPPLRPSSALPSSSSS